MNEALLGLTAAAALAGVVILACALCALLAAGGL